MLAALAIPAFAALLIVLAGAWPNLRETTTLVAALALAGAVAALIAGFDAGSAAPLVLAQLLPGFSLTLRAEPIGLIFAGVASGLWILNSLYSIGYMRAEHARNQTRYYACFALALSATMAIALAGNLATLFVAYEALTLVTYPLVVHWQTEGAIAGARRYLAYLLATSLVPFLAALVWTWGVAGTLDFVPGGILDGKLDDGLLALLLGLYAYGVGKAALMPLHGWLPAAMVAPTPVSALLHAVAVVKAGVFTLLKIAVYIFGIETIGRGVGDWLVWVAAGSVIAASLIALSKDDLKARLAYSTVAQLALVTLAVAIGHPLAIAAGVLQLVMHAWGKITLFFGAGAIQIATHKKKLSEIGGIGRRMPLLIIAILLGTLSVAGLPPFGGLWAKALLGDGAAARGLDWVSAMLLVSSLLTLSYLLPIVLKACFGQPTEGSHHHAPVPPGMLAATLVTAAGTLALFFAAPAIIDFLAPVLAPVSGRAASLEAALHHQAAWAELGLVGLIFAAAALFRHSPLPRWGERLGGLLAWPGLLLAGAGTLAEQVLAAVARPVAGLIGSIARTLTIGGAGDGVLWTLALLAVILIVSFG
ncbi:monovalent cation/H+ antiporter subunit D family protein [Oleomonas cavernae]|uniref:Monovalent cation/H+ antiporter subunit D family protein n=2 Tax=Oleomonas cavernae TaxID=2320859 RepID=A0A418W9L1_9PROT|nr:monovalent cation/H+ antiporter subunit D family protein [Oleomonas cavernae]